MKKSFWVFTAIILNLFLACQNKVNIQNNKKDFTGDNYEE